MNVQLRINEVKPVLDPKLSIEQIGRTLQQFASKSNLIFPIPQVGHGYQQWSLPGMGWTSFANLPEDKKADAATAFIQRKNTMMAQLNGSPIRDAVFTVPSDDFIYFRQNGTNWEIAVAAWGFRYPDKIMTSEIDVWVRRDKVQDVNIGFSWDGQLLPNYSFRLEGYDPRLFERVTGPDGFLHFDKPAPVGKTYSLETMGGRGFRFTVETGKADYIFDLTEYFFVDVDVRSDGSPVADCPCDISFFGNTLQNTTDETGHISAKIALLCTSDGTVDPSQPQCIVTCNADTRRQTPVNAGDHLHFIFDFDTPPPPPGAKPAKVEIEVVKDGAPVEGKACKVSFNGHEYNLTTDAVGRASVEIVLECDEEGQPIAEQPDCLAECDDHQEIKKPLTDGTPLLFKFDLSEEPTPKFVQIVLKDYIGEPLVDMPFKLKLKQKGEISLKTDDKGQCMVPMEWFTHNEKMKVKFVVTAEYQKTHDIHENVKKQKK